MLSNTFMDQMGIRGTRYDIHTNYQCVDTTKNVSAKGTTNCVLYFIPEGQDVQQ